MRCVSAALIGGLAIVWATVCVSGQAPGGDAKVSAATNPVPSTAASIAEGRKVYQVYCRHCHGAKALGDGPLAPKDPPPANLTDDKWDHGSSDGEIFAVISNGAGPDSQMKAMKGMLSPTDIWNVVNYLRSLGPKPASPPAGASNSARSANPVVTAVSHRRP